MLHGVALRGGGWVTNMHGSTHPPEQRRADLFLAAETALGWAGGGPLVFGGDLNSTQPAMPGLTHVARPPRRPRDGRRAARRPRTLEVLDAGRCRTTSRCG